MSDNYSLKISTTGTSPYSLYVSCNGATANPTKFEYDLKYTQIDAAKAVKLTPDSLPMCGKDSGFVALVEVHGFDVPFNEALVNSIEIEVTK